MVNQTPLNASDREALRHQLGHYPNAAECDGWRAAMAHFATKKSNQKIMDGLPAETLEMLGLGAYVKARTELIVASTALRKGDKIKYNQIREGVVDFVGSGSIRIQFPSGGHTVVRHDTFLAGGVTRVFEITEAAPPEMVWQNGDVASLRHAGPFEDEMRYRIGGRWFDPDGDEKFPGTDAYELIMRDGKPVAASFNGDTEPF